MSVHLKREIDNIKKRVLALGAKVEDSVRLAILAIENRDEDLAIKVISSDIDIDNMEVEVEEDCLKILALHQPVATDLRFIIAVLKIDNDLERIGDLSVNIAERAAFLALQPPTNITFDFVSMAQKTKLMLKESLDALVNLSPELARKVCADDEEVDAMNSNIYQRFQEGIREHPEQIDSLIHLFSVSRHLERIADHATNIAEDVIYMITGEIIRHKAEDFRTAP